ncbi:MAG: hypothetical protein HUK19_08720 [Fibrobacter sp.]|nr:hypothetical protein [Fibrobacter sp.]
MKKSFFYLAFSLVLCVGLTGCLSHWFIETTSRLQVENATEDCTVKSVDIFSADSTSYVRWVDEQILPGERSRVVENDWVGNFRIRVNYTRSTDGSGKTLHYVKKMEVEGGSLFLKVESDEDSLSLKFR